MPLWWGIGRFFVAVFAIAIFLSAFEVLQAQAPKAVTLQSVLRDATGRLVANRGIGVRISLKKGSASGTQVYQEVHLPTTNQNGLYTVLFGQGTPVSGSFDDIDWADGPYYATVEADPDGGNNYTLTISHPIVSVPYALYAEDAKEKQVLSLGHDTIYLTGGSYVKLPAMGGAGSDSLARAANRKVDSLIRVSCIATVHYVKRTECDSFTWTVTGEKLTGTKIYQFVREKGNKKGCDSIEMLDLVINRSSHQVEKATATGFYNWHGVARANSGTYTYPYNNTYGCPSVDTLKLVVNTAGALPGEFTVNASGKKVKFSRGNLQYHAKSNTWRFAWNQWDVIQGVGGIGNGAGNDAWFDLFGWGTSGHQVLADAGNLRYQPWETATTGATYNTYGYGPSTNMAAPHLTGASNINDWGVPNAISNGGLQTGKWRTLTTEEWAYIFNTRPQTIGRYCFGQVNGRNGIILLPDSYVHPAGVATLNTLNNANGAYTNNPITAAGWTAMEAAGAVFLPCAGYRVGTGYYEGTSYGRYWSASRQDATYAYSVFFQNTGTTNPGRLLPSVGSHPRGEGYYDGFYHDRWHARRYYGFSVRLVQNVN